MNTKKNETGIIGQDQTEMVKSDQTTTIDETTETMQGAPGIKSNPGANVSASQ